MAELNLPLASRFLEFPAAAVPSLGSRERVRIHYVEGGRGRAILFLHGNPTAAFMWRKILPTAARHGRALAIDLLGHGLSDKPDIAYTFDDHGAITPPARLAWLRKNVSTAELCSVGRGGHYLPEEVPEAIAAAFDEWLPRVLEAEGAPSGPPQGIE